MGKNKFKKKAGESLVERKKRLRDASRKLATEEKENGTPKFTVDQLLDKAQEYTDKFEYEMAQKFCQRALEMDNDNVRALETTGALLLELGNIDAAKQCYGRAVEVCPDQGYLKYMNLGQLFEGAEAIQCYQKGIELMVAEKAKRETEEVAAACGSESAIAAKDVSTAYLSIAEIYMTDCCFEEDAENQCRNHIEKSIDADKDNPDAVQLMASFLLSKEKNEEAKEMIKKSVSMWLPDFLASEKQQEASNMFAECPQSFESRLSAGKILIEVSEYEMAIDVLETLLEEEDETVDVWYLIGWASYLLGDEGKDNARSYLNKAKKVYKKTKCKDEELLKHIDELLEAVGEGEDLMDSDIEDNVGDEDNDEYEDIESDDEEEEEEEKNQGQENMEH